MSRFIAIIIAVAAFPATVWAADAPAEPPQPTFTLGYALLIMCVILGIAAVVRSTTKATSDEE